MEPSGEPETTSGPLGAVRAGAEAVLPALRALLSDSTLLPQQVLGQLDFVERALNIIMLNLADMTSYAKYRRIKLAALRKQITHKPERAEALLTSAGFRPALDATAGGTPEYLEWGPIVPNEDTALRPSLEAALGTLVLIGRIKDRAKVSGNRSLNDNLQTEIGMQDLLRLEFGCDMIVEPSGGAAGSSHKVSSQNQFMVTQTFLQEQRPALMPLLNESFRFLQVGVREKKVIQLLLKNLNDRRGENEKLQHSLPLERLAQLMAGSVLVGLRKESLVQAAATAEAETSGTVVAAVEDGPSQDEVVAEPDLEPPTEEAVGNATAEVEAGDAAMAEAAAIEEAAAAATPSSPSNRSKLPVTVEDVVLPSLIDCLPVVRLGLPYKGAKAIIYLREFPSYFTSSVNEKQFQVSVSEVASRLCDVIQEGIPKDARVVGFGCAIDISLDDKAIVFGISL